MKKLKSNCTKSGETYRSNRFNKDVKTEFLSNSYGYASYSDLSCNNLDYKGKWSIFDAYLFQENEIVEIDGILCSAQKEPYLEDLNIYVLLLKPL